MEKKLSHIHKFKRLRYKSGNIIFFCALPDCSQKINIALALGKRSLCWRCGNEFLITEYSLRLAKPHCESCHKPKKVADIPTFDSLSLSDRLSQTIQQAQEQEEEI